MPTKIVLIDDEAITAKRYKSQLEALGYEVEFINTLKSYDELRRKLKSQDWDDVALFLVDVMMPPEADDSRCLRAAHCTRARWCDHARLLLLCEPDRIHWPLPR